MVCIYSIFSVYACQHNVSDGNATRLNRSPVPSRWSRPQSPPCFHGQERIISGSPTFHSVTNTVCRTSHPRPEPQDERSHTLYLALACIYILCSLDTYPVSVERTKIQFANVPAYSIRADTTDYRHIRMREWPHNEWLN